jgi:hypothetical protein
VVRSIFIVVSGEAFAPLRIASNVCGEPKADDEVCQILRNACHPSCILPKPLGGNGDEFSAVSVIPVAQVLAAESQKSEADFIQSPNIESGLSLSLFS